MAGNAWANIEPCVRKFYVEFDGFATGCLVGCKNKWCGSKWGWVDAQQDVVHDWVANHHDFQNLVGGNIGLLSKFYYQQIEGIANGECQLFFATLVHHHVGNSTHQVLAETNLGVHYASTAEHFTASEIAEMPRNRCRTDVDSNSVHGTDKTGPCSNNAAWVGRGRTMSHCDCCTTVTLVDCKVHLLQRVSGDCRYSDVVLLSNRIAQLAGCGDVFTQ